MRVKIVRPHPHLREFINNYVYCEIGHPDKWSQSSMAPPGCAKLAIVLQPEQILASENGNEPRIFPPLIFVGQVTHFIPFSWYGQLKVFFVMFRPCGAFPLVEIPQQEFKNTPCSFSDMMNSAAYLKERIAGQDQPEELKRIMDLFFIQKLSAATKKQVSQKYQSLRLAEAVKKMHAFNLKGRSISKICRQTGYSLSTFERRMKKIVGITPKQLERIIRLNQVMEFINKNLNNPHLSWPDLAHRFGYYDQAHFIKEFKHFNGQTPSQYIRGNSHFLSDLALDDNSGV